MFYESLESKRNSCRIEFPKDYHIITSLNDTTIWSKFGTIKFEHEIKESAILMAISYHRNCFWIEQYDIKEYCDLVKTIESFLDTQIIVKKN